MDGGSGFSVTSTREKKLSRSFDIGFEKVTKPDEGISILYFSVLLDTSLDQIAVHFLKCTDASKLNEFASLIMHTRNSRTISYLYGGSCYPESSNA